MTPQTFLNVYTSDIRYNTTYALELLFESTPAFNASFGYGLVNAAAVAKAIALSPFTNVANLRGENWGGVDILSTVPNNKYDYKPGTSMASPHVAGVVALMLSANPNLTAAQIRQILTETATQLA
ncbi:S8 family serine peptidase [Fortiea contorta]|uniref:S8 family serine peptidase n=1 Tax=Fortiea contorta TaxID=1892405 RepID=UPI00037E9B58